MRPFGRPFGARLFLSSILLALLLIAPSARSAAKSPTAKATIAKAPTRAPITSSKLGNGLRILTLSDPATPTVTAGLWIKAGWVHNPRGREGLADLCAATDKQRVRQAIAKGRLGKPYFSEWFDSSVSSDYTVFSVIALAGDLEPALDALRAVARASDDAFVGTSSLKRDAILNLMRTRFVPGLVAREALGTVLFGDRRPLGFSARFQTLLGLLPQDARAFQDNYYRPENAIVTVEGAIESDAAGAAVQRLFGDWKGAASIPEAPAWGRAAPAPARPGVTLIDDPDATEVVIIGGLSGPGRDDPQGFTALQLLHQVVGGGRIEAAIGGADSTGGKARIPSPLRRFLAQIRTNARGSELTVETATSHETAAQVLTNLQRALAELGRSGIPDAEFNVEVRARAAARPFRLETGSARMREAVAHLLADQKPEDPSETKALLGLDRQGVMARWKALLDPGHMVWVVLGRGSELAPRLAAAGIEPAHGDPFDVVTGRLLQQEESPFPLPGPISTVHAEEMILAAIEAKGGFEALERVENYTLEDTLFVHAGGRTTPGTRKVYVRFPDRYREDLEMAAFQGRRLVQVVNGNDVWRNHLGLVSNASGPRRQELLSRLWLEGLRIFHRYGEPGAQAFLIDPDVVGGVTLDGFQISSPDGNWVRVYLHPQSRLVVKRTTQRPTEKRMLAVDEIFTNYLPVEGVFVPFISATYLDGEFTTESHTAAVNFNVELDHDLFVRAE